MTDNLADTVCYDALVTTLKKKLLNKSYRLLEHLAAEMYGILKKIFLNQASISLRINKKPAILNLTGGASFCYGDEGETW